MHVSKLILISAACAFLLLTACGPDEKPESGMTKADSDSIARISIQRERDSLARLDSLAELVQDSSMATPQMDSAAIMETVNILDSIKALKNK